MKKIKLLIIPVLIGINASAQYLPTVSLPVIDTPTIIVPTDTIYLDFINGNDANNGQSTSSAVKTFNKAVNSCPYGVGNNGQSYTEIAILPGNYLLTVPLKQYHNQYYKMTPKPGGGYDTSYRNISLRGIGDVTLNGENLTINSGGAIVELLGSNIYIKDLKITNSNINGIRFNDSTSLWVDSAVGPSFRVAYHDILVSNVHISNCGYFGLHFLKGKRLLVENSIFNNNCLVNENRAVQLYTGQVWPSALKCQFSQHVTFRNNKVFNNWGEGLNFNKSKLCEAYNNTAWDNFSINFYFDHASSSILRDNLLFNTTDTTFWIASDSGVVYDHKYGTINISIGGESYSNMGGYQNSKNNFIFNNVCINGPSNFGGTHGSTSYPYTLTHKNVWFAHNLFHGFQGEPSAVQRVFSFPDTLGLYSSSLTVIDSVYFINNIITIDTNKLSGSTDELCRSTVTPLPSKLFYFNNLWIKNPQQPGRNTLFNSTYDVINNSIPFNNDTINYKNVYNSFYNESLIMPVAKPSFILYDYNSSMRNDAYSNVGPFEFVEPLSIDNAGLNFFYVQKQNANQIYAVYSFTEKVGKVEILKSTDGNNWKQHSVVSPVERVNTIMDNDLTSSVIYYKAVTHFTDESTSVSQTLLFKNNIDDKGIYSFYPNPYEKVLHIQNPTEKTLTMQVLSINGNFIHEQSISSQSITEYYSMDLPQGIYIINLLNDKNEIVATRKVIKK